MEKAREALLELEYDDLKSVFNNLMNTNGMFWDLLSYVESLDIETVINYMVEKLLNDCTEKEIISNI